MGTDLHRLNIWRNTVEHLYSDSTQAYSWRLKEPFYTVGSLKEAL